MVKNKQFWQQIVSELKQINKKIKILDRFKTFIYICIK